MEHPGQERAQDCRKRDAQVVERPEETAKGEEQDQSNISDENHPSDRDGHPAKGTRRGTGCCHHSSYICDLLRVALLIAVQCTLKGIMPANRILEVVSALPSFCEVTGSEILRSQ